MRYYDIEIGQGESLHRDRNNPQALNNELDINIYDADAISGCTAVIWGIALADISQATDLANKDRHYHWVGRVSKGFRSRMSKHQRREFS